MVVLVHKPPKTTIVCTNGIYYLYGVSSKRIKGVKLGSKKVDVTDTLVHEYGYSMFLYHVGNSIKERIKKYYPDIYDLIFKSIISKLFYIF